MLYKRWPFYLMLGGIALAIWAALDPFFGSEFAERVRRGGLSLQLLGVATVGIGIYRILKGSDYTLHEVLTRGEATATEVKGVLSLKGEGGTFSASGYVPKVGVPVEERLETLEKRQVELFSELSRVEQELEKELSKMQKGLERERNRREKTAERLREEWEEALTSNLDLEVVGFVWVFVGIAMRLFFG